MNIRPVLQALVLADHVYIDAKTGKKVIAGTFNHLSAPQFPANFVRSRFAFVSLTDVYGITSITLKYVDLSNNDVLLELSGFEVEAEDPLDTVELVIELSELPMPHEGVYAFEVHAGEEMIGALRVFVSRREKEEEPPMRFKTT